MVKVAFALLTLVLFCAVVSAKVDLYVDYQNVGFYGAELVIYEVKNIGNESTYVLNSLSIFDEKGNAIYTSKEPSSAEVVRINPGISYAFQRGRCPTDGFYTVKIYHGDNWRNLKAISINSGWTETCHAFDFPLHSDPILYTDKTIYKYGENVGINLMNLDTFYTTHFNVNNWKIKNLDTGKVVYRVSKDCTFGYGGCADSFEPIGPWKNVKNVWNQTDINGNQVVPGKYIVTAENLTPTTSPRVTPTPPLVTLTPIPFPAPTPFLTPTSPYAHIKSKSSKRFYINPPLLVRGDLNDNGISADAGDLDMMKKASIGEITSDIIFDLNKNGIPADAGDLVLMKRASRGEIDLQNNTSGKG